MRDCSMADSNRVHRLRDLLSQAVQCLGTSSTSSSSASSSSSAQILPQTIRERSIHSERNLLFNFGARRPRRLQPRNVPSKSKKKKLPTWSHEFVCLANKNQAKTTTSYERSVLISAGMFYRLQQVSFVCGGKRVPL